MTDQPTEEQPLAQVVSITAKRPRGAGQVVATVYDLRPSPGCLPWPPPPSKNMGTLDICPVPDDDDSGIAWP